MLLLFSVAVFSMAENVSGGKGLWGPGAVEGRTCSRTQHRGYPLPCGVDLSRQGRYHDSPGDGYDGVFA